MQYSEFERQVDRLRGVYSAGSLNPERIKVWWDRFKNEKASVFESALNHIIAEATTQALPAMSRIVEACGMFRTNPQGARFEELAHSWNCVKCRDTGWDAKDYSRATGAGTIVPCGCQASKGLSPHDLAKIQKEFDLGAKLLRGKTPFIGAPLPYDKGERIKSDPEQW